MSSFLMHFLIGSAALAGLIVGAELIVKKSKALALALGISDFFIGLTILSIGTSIPEIATHLIGSIRVIQGKAELATISGIVIGTNVGSNLIQISFITGFVTFFGWIYATKDLLKKDYLMMLLSILLLFFLGLNGSISRLEGIALILIYIGYLWWTGKKERVIYKASRRDKSKRIGMDSLLLLIGIALVIFSADWVLKSAIFFVNRFLIPSSLIGVLCIGIATALPEFTTAATALLRKAGGLSIGTLIGSNITNPLLALGAGAAISGYKLSGSILFIDIPAWFFISLVTLFLLLRRMRLERKEGIILIGSYLLFLFFRLKFFGY